MTETPKTGLAMLREPFPQHLVSKLPKGTKAQNECPAEQKKTCTICGGWHHPQIKHLDYVGHAALTHRLLDVDELWTWEPAAIDAVGNPVFDATGGLWIKLTVLGVTRWGYGNADSKPFMDKGAREKECIGDALRNAAMRFGAALDLWHKGDLHAGDADPSMSLLTDQQIADWLNVIECIDSADKYKEIKGQASSACRHDEAASKTIVAALKKKYASLVIAYQGAKT
jgi:hypothetical protein